MMMMMTMTGLPLQHPNKSDFNGLLCPQPEGELITILTRDF
jgi:hypothetical protein